MKLLFVALVLLAFCSTNAQTVSITATASSSPLSLIGQSTYHASESIYTETEIGAGNFISGATAINRINFSINTLGINSTINNFTIYLKNVALGTTTVSSGVYSTAGYTLVYSGTFTPSSTGWVGVNLTTPFTRTAGTNLEVLIERTDNTLHTGYTVDVAAGNTVGSTVDPTALSSRRYNNITPPVSGTTTLTETSFRPAIQLIHTFTTDASLTALINPFSSCFSLIQVVSVTLKNEGSGTISPGNASVTLHIRGANTFTASINNITSLSPGATEIIAFVGINLNNSGVSTDTAFVSLTGDVNSSNDTLKSDITTTTTISTFPAVEDAEGALLVFSNTTSDDWTIQSGNYTNIDLTGPLAPHGGNQFYLFDSYNAAVDVTSRLYSNCLQLPLLSTDNITFWMSHDNSFSTFPDSMYLEVTTNKGVTWTRLAGFARYDATFGTPGWRMETVDLSAYAGQTIQISFEGVSKFGNVIGVDDITISANSVLPVTIVDFNARRYGKVNNLSWNTSQEFNTTHFVIERSTDGRNFAAIGKVKASGSSSVNHQYSFTDLAPVKGVNYYRLQVVDVDNSAKYTLVRSVRNIGTIDMSIYPNPVNSLSKLAINSEKTGVGLLTIIDAEGHQVVNKNITVITGDNIIPLNFNQLSGGIYVLKLLMNDELITRKFSR